MTTEEQLDYLAGFFDAEGCVYMWRGQNTRHIRFAAVQTEPDVLLLFKALFGGSLGIATKQLGRVSNLWRWEKHVTSNSEFVNVMRNRLIIKRRAIALAEQFARSLRPVGGSGRLTEKDREERASIAEKLSLVNGGEFDKDGHFVETLPIPYCAGLFDGDGTATVRRENKGRSFYSTVAVYSAYRPLLEALVRQYGGYAYDNYRGSRPGEWQAHRRKAEEFLRSVSPYLIVKKAVGERVLALSERKYGAVKVKSVMNGKTHWVFRDEDVEKMCEITSEIRLLNADKYTLRMA